MYSTPLRSDPFRAGCSVIERASGAEGEGERGVGGGSCNERDDADAPGCLREGREREETPASSPLPPLPIVH